MIPIGAKSSFTVANYPPPGRGKRWGTRRLSVWTTRSVAYPSAMGGHRAKLTLGAVAAVAALSISSCGGSEPSAPLAQVRQQAHSRIAEERPPRAQPPYDVLPRNSSAAKRAAPSPEPAPEPEPTPKHLDPSEMPPASAGTNGSYVPDPAAERETITPRTMAKLEHRAASGSAVLLSGVALAPPSAPQRIKAAISAANTIIGRPYIWGGGHASWYSRGYDCSGAVSYALAGGGFLSTPLTSNQLESWGAPGPGRWLTVYANAGHTYAVIAGLRWDTVGDARGTGPRWHPALPYPEGFVARHPPGFYGMAPAPDDWSDPGRVAEYLSREIPHRLTAEQMLLEALPSRVGRFLDLGTGDGRMVALVRSRHPEARAVGLDASEPMLARAADRFATDRLVELHAHELGLPLPVKGPLRRGRLGARDSPSRGRAQAQPLRGSQGAPRAWRGLRQPRPRQLGLGSDSTIASAARSAASRTTRAIASPASASSWVGCARLDSARSTAISSGWSSG